VGKTIYKEFLPSSNLSVLNIRGNPFIQAIFNLKIKKAFSKVFVLCFWDLGRKGREGKGSLLQGLLEFA
jgi:hypothetical protein